MRVFVVVAIRNKKRCHAETSSSYVHARTATHKHRMIHGDGDDAVFYPPPVLFPNDTRSRVSESYGNATKGANTLNKRTITKDDGGAAKMLR